MSHADNTTNASQPVEPAFYRLADIIRITALSRSSIYRRIAAGDFPAQVPLGKGRAKGWRREALQAWIDDPVGFRPLATCEVQQGSAGGRVRRVIATPASSVLRRG